MNERDILESALIENNYHLSPTQIDLLLKYLSLLHKWNRVYNLTAITDFKESVYLHIIDSLSISSYLSGDSILDVGTGAGLPGIPLAIINHDKKFTLLDSNKKKTTFLNQVVLELSLTNVTPVWARAEAFKPEHCFNSILSRAFASLKVMLETTKHLLCKDGYFLAMKGIKPEEELQEVSKLKNIKLNTIRLPIKGLDAQRHLVSMQWQDKE